MFEGRIRASREPDNYSDQNVLSLSVVSSHYIQKVDDDRTFYRFEVAWDSSMHNSILLNRVTPSKDWIYITITCYIQMENFVQPACITKDLCLVFYARDARVSLPRSLRSLIYGGTYKSNDANKVSGLYKLTVKQAADSSSPGAHRRYGRVIDTSNSYVRGEEMLKGWRPRSDSLIFEHQWELEKLTRLQHVERTRHSILLNNMIESLKNDEPSSKSTNKHQLNTQNSIANKSLNSSPDYDDDYENTSYTDNQKQLLLNCIKLINKGRVQTTNEKSSENESMSSSATTSHYNIPNINVIYLLYLIIYKKVYLFFINNCF